MRNVLLLTLLAACGGTQPPPPPPPPQPSIDAELTPAFTKVQPWLGHWRSDDGSTTHWTAADGAMYGVWFHDRDFNVMVVDDGEGPRPPDGVLRYIAIPSGQSSTERKDLTAAELAVFPHIAGYRAMKIERGPDDAAVEAADRAFAADVKARGADGWLAAFDEDGGMLRKTGRIEGAAIREAMADTLANGLLAWDPIASGAEGELGYTVGKATYTPNTAGEPGWASTYITIWRRQPDGSWKVLFDTGRAVNR
ncbi:MAG TPA: nuclear transport factor 2 family protein [Kofleriaceae bacterium]|nr:nuclear transport factor 2 family protein [Kofleriaceae bacterium]